VDGSTANITNSWGYVDGQLTGAGLTGAIVSFNLGGALGANSEWITGVAAFSGAAQLIATPYRSISVSYYDPASLTSKMGFYTNNSARVTQDATGNLTQFDTSHINSGGGGSQTIASNSSTLTNFGTDPVTGISWGRWSGGTINVTDRATGTVTPVSNAGSLHWIAEPVATAAVTLPVSGTYTYTMAGGTLPTDNLGNIGTLNSATLAANFSTQTVNMGVNATVNGATLNAVATNAPIIQQTAFYASSQEASSSASHLNVTCSGSNCGAALGGTIVGKFTGAGATGAAMSYGLNNGTTVVSGVVALHR
jgi:hypothetical protein